MEFWGLAKVLVGLVVLVACLLYLTKEFPDAGSLAVFVLLLFSFAISYWAWG